MDLGLLVIWAVYAWWLLEENQELLCEIEVWRQVVATVLLVVGAPVFLLGDFLELLLDLVTGDEDE